MIEGAGQAGKLSMEQIDNLIEEIGGAYMSDIKYIMNIMKYNKVCKCDLCNSIFEEMIKKEVMNISKGIYSEILDSTVKFVGLVGSKKGPVLFLDREQYVITNDNFDFIQQSMRDLKVSLLHILMEKKQFN